MKDIDNLIKDYLNKGQDFGFSGVNEVHYEETIKEKNLTLEEYKIRCESIEKNLKEIEELIAPLLANLLKTANSPYIHWPNREKPVKELMKRFLEKTRI